MSIAWTAHRIYWRNISSHLLQHWFFSDLTHIPRWFSTIFRLYCTIDIMYFLSIILPNIIQQQINKRTTLKTKTNKHIYLHLWSIYVQIKSTTERLSFPFLCVSLFLSVCPEDMLRQYAAQIMPAFLIHGGSFDQRLLGTFPLPSSVWHFYIHSVQGTTQPLLWHRSSLGGFTISTEVSEGTLKFQDEVSGFNCGDERLATCPLPNSGWEGGTVSTAAIGGVFTGWGWLLMV